MSKSRNTREYDEDKFERRARKSMRNNQSASDWKFDPRKDYNREEWEEREKRLERARLR